MPEVLRTQCLPVDGGGLWQQLAGMRLTTISSQI